MRLRATTAAGAAWSCLAAGPARRTLQTYSCCIWRHGAGRSQPSRPPALPPATHRRSVCKARRPLLPPIKKTLRSSFHCILYQSLRLVITALFCESPAVHWVGLEKAQYALQAPSCTCTAAAMCHQSRTCLSWTSRP